jgi:hypothetical protein
MVKTYKVVEHLRAVSTLDLTADQIEEIEAATDLPFNQWGVRGSLMKVLRHVLAAGNGTDPDALKGTTMRELKALVSLDDGEDDGEAGTEAPDPDR